MQYDQQPQNVTITQRSSSLLATHVVLRKTYFLLSLTLLFSGVMAYVAMVTNAPTLGWLGIIAMFGLLFLTTALRNSPWGIVSVFAFTGFMGYSLGPFLNAYLAAYTNGGQLIMTAMGGTGIIFFALSAYALVSKKDFSFLGGFLFAGVIAILIAVVLGMFFQSSMLQLVISAAAMMIFSGYILYDTSAIIHGGEQSYVMATMRLFIDILNVFTSLLNLLGAFSGNRN